MRWDAVVTPEWRRRVGGDNKFSGLCEKLENIKKRGGAGRREVCVCAYV